MHFRSAIYLLTLFLFIGACSSSKEATEEDGEEGAMVKIDENLPAVRQARIFLDGKDKGLTPRVLRVDRRFNYSEILLRIGKERVRLFEIEQTRTSNASETIFGFSTTTDGYYTEIYAEDLPKKNDKYFYIPFRSDPLLITDRQYGLQIIVQ